MHRKETIRSSWKAALAWAKRKAKELNEPIFIYLDYYDEFDERLPKPIYRFIRESSYNISEEIREEDVVARVHQSGSWEGFYAGGESEVYDR